MKINLFTLGFCTMLLLSAGFILLFGTLRPLPISSRVQKEKFWADKVHAKKRYEAIIAGDSRVYRGVDPNSLSDEIEGMRVLNFGFSSGGFNDMMFSEINSRLLKQAPQKIIILGITPYSVTPKAQENKHFLQEKNRNPKEVFTRRYINPFLSFFDPITPKELLQNTDTIRGYHETFHKNGWVASYKVPSNPEAALRSYKNNFTDNQVKQEILNNLYRQISKWSRESVKIYAFRVPSSRTMEILEDSLSGFNEKAVSMNIESAGGYWLEIEGKYESYDGSHLTEISAIAFSRYLGQQIFENLRSLN